MFKQILSNFSRLRKNFYKLFRDNSGNKNITTFFQIYILKIIW